MKKILVAVGVFIAALGGYASNDMLGAGVNTGERTMLNEVIAVTTSSAFLVNDFRNIEITVANTALTGTIKAVCSAQTDVDFDAVPSATNRYDTVELIDLSDGSSLPGSTGIVASADTSVSQYEVNANNFYYCAVVLQPFTSGTSTVKLRPANNQ